MRTRDLEMFRKLLEDRLAALYRSSRADVREMINRSPYEQDDYGDDGDESVRIQGHGLLMGLKETEAALAQQCEEALRRITSGDYGTCIDCGGEIELARLKAVPWAIRCAEDQEAKEFDGRDHSPSL